MPEVTSVQCINSAFSGAGSCNQSYPFNLINNGSRGDLSWNINYYNDTVHFKCNNGSYAPFDASLVAPMSRLYYNEYQGQDSDNFYIRVSINTGQAQAHTSTHKSVVRGPNHIIYENGNSYYLQFACIHP